MLTEKNNRPVKPVFGKGPVILGKVANIPKVLISKINYQEIIFQAFRRIEIFKSQFEWFKNTNI